MSGWRCRKSKPPRVFRGRRCNSLMNPENPWIDLAPGIRRRTITHGATMYQMIAELEAGSIMPEHNQPQEQIMHLLAGRMKVNVGGVSHEMGPGDSFYLAGNVSHGVETIEKTTVLDTFSPPRDEYIALDKQATRGGGRTLRSCASTVPES